MTTVRTRRSSAGIRPCAATRWYALVGNMELDAVDRYLVAGELPEPGAGCPQPHVPGHPCRH
jgi:hypothetical protein